VNSEYPFEQVAARVHGRLYHRGASKEASGLLLIGFHGYGESAEDLLRELDRLPGSSKWSLASVQALHPFYNRRTGKVVAGWMTRQDRLTAIEDNLRYVSSVVERLMRDQEPDAPIVYLGFSQGTAMAYRSASAVDHPCQGVIALAGDVPPELGEADLGDFPPVLIGLGDADEWYGETKAAQDLALLSAQQVPCEVVRFSGGHEWTDEFRAEASRWLQKIAVSR